MLFSKEVTLALLLSAHTETTDYNMVGGSYRYRIFFFFF